MKCPVCEVDLQMAERQGVEIDYCPKCRGVWLDRGELDKIIERASAEYGPLRGQDEAARPDEQRFSEPRRDERPHERYDRSYEEYSRQGESHGKKRKKPTSFLMDIFEGFGE